MAGFYYFFEHQEFAQEGLVNHDWCNSHGLQSLSDVITMPRDATCTKSVGPTGSGGHVLYVKPVSGGEPRSYIYHASQQTWLERDGFWIGWDNLNPPKPEDLQRKDISSGYELIDGYENKWILPIVRSPQDRGTLPVDYGFDKTGSQLVKRVKKRYERYWDLAGQAVDYLLLIGDVDQSELNKQFPEQWVITTAAEFMGINYRVGVHEVSALLECGKAPIDTNFAVKVFHAVTDWYAVIATADFLKKKEATKQQFLSAESPSLSASVVA